MFFRPLFRFPLSRNQDPELMADQKTAENVLKVSETSVAVSETKENTLKNISKCSPLKRDTITERFKVPFFFYKYYL